MGMLINYMNNIDYVSDSKKLYKELVDKIDNIKNNHRSPINLNNEVIGYLIKDNHSLVVAIENKYNIEISEKYNSISIKNRIYNFGTLDGNVVESNVICLCCNNLKLIEPFAKMCELFLLEDREDIQKNPLNWYLKWKELIGNRFVNRPVYDVLAELLAYRYYLTKDSTFTWKIDEYKTHDLESESFDVEVKSTLQKYTKEINVSSQYQLEKTLGRNLNLLFVRLEQSNLGLSIVDVLNTFSEDRRNDALKRIQKLGFDEKSIEFKERYNVLEVTEYKVDNSFPKITNSSFVNGAMPENIKKIVYTIDLNGILGENIETELIVKDI